MADDPVSSASQRPKSIQPPWWLVDAVYWKQKME